MRPSCSMITLTFSLLSLLVIRDAAAQPTLVIPRLNTTGTTTSEDGEASRISVGFNAGSSEYPWMTAVMLPNGMCGGVLVAPDAVLTSAHCLIEWSESDILSFTRLYIGILDYTTLSFCKDCQVRRVKSFYINPTFKYEMFFPNNDLELEGDIAIMMLDTPSTKPPASIPDIRPLTGTEGVILGWGKTAATQATSPILQYTTVQVLDSSECQGFGGKDYYNEAVSICGSSYGTWPDNLTSSSCEGDSGGPMIVPGTNDVLGLMSYAVLPSGSAPCGQYLRTVMMSTAQYRPWLMQYIDVDRSPAPPALSPPPLDPSSPPPSPVLVSPPPPRRRKPPPRRRKPPPPRKRKPPPPRRKRKPPPPKNRKRPPPPKRQNKG